MNLKCLKSIQNQHLKTIGGNMKKIDIPTLNKTNANIWAKITLAYQSKNWATMEKQLKRLHGLQSYYCHLMNLQDHENRELKIMLNAAESQINQQEKEWITEVAKRTGTFDRITQELDEIFGDEK